MQTAIFNSESKSDMRLIINMAKKLGIKSKILIDTEIEDIAMGYAIKEGITGENVDTLKFLKKLKK